MTVQRIQHVGNACVDEVHALCRDFPCDCPCHHHFIKGQTWRRVRMYTDFQWLCLMLAWCGLVWLAFVVLAVVIAVL